MKVDFRLHQISFVQMAHRTVTRTYFSHAHFVKGICDSSSITCFDSYITAELIVGDDLPICRTLVQ